MRTLPRTPERVRELERIRTNAHTRAGQSEGGLRSYVREGYIWVHRLDQFWSPLDAVRFAQRKILF